MDRRLRNAERKWKMEKDKYADITVIMPCHNREKYVEEALQSAANQTLRPARVIAVDDGSTDRSVEVMKKTGIADQIIQVEFKNAAAARNAGIGLVTTEWIAFLDSDDSWYPEHLETAMHILTNTSDIAYITPYDAWVTETGRILEVYNGIGDEVRTGLNEDDAIDLLLRFQFGFPTPGMVLKTQKVKEVGGFDGTQLRRHDIEMFLRLILSGTWSFNPTPNYAMRAGIPGRISNQKDECSYYKLRALHKFQGMLSRPERIESYVRKLSKIAVNDTACSGKKDLFRQAYSYASPHMTFPEKIFYQFSSYAPITLRAWNAIRPQQIADGSKDEDNYNVASSLDEVYLWRKSRNQTPT